MSAHTPWWDNIFVLSVPFVIAGGFVGWATATYLPYWMVFIWTGALLLGGWESLKRVSFYGTAFLMMIGFACFTIPMLLVYAITIAQPALQ